MKHEKAVVQITNFTKITAFKNQKRKSIINSLS